MSYTSSAVVCYHDRCHDGTLSASYLNQYSSLLGHTAIFVGGTYPFDGASFDHLRQQVTDSNRPFTNVIFADFACPPEMAVRLSEEFGTVRIHDHHDTNRLAYDEYRSKHGFPPNVEVDIRENTVSGADIIVEEYYPGMPKPALLEPARVIDLMQLDHPDYWAYSAFFNQVDVTAPLKEVFAQFDRMSKMPREEMIAEGNRQKPKLVSYANAILGRAQKTTFQLRGDSKEVFVVRDVDVHAKGGRFVTDMAYTRACETGVPFILVWRDGKTLSIRADGMVNKASEVAESIAKSVPGASGGGNTLLAGAQLPRRSSLDALYRHPHRVPHGAPGAGHSPYRRLRVFPRHPVLTH